MTAVVESTISLSIHQSTSSYPRAGMDPRDVGIGDVYVPEAVSARVDHDIPPLSDPEQAYFWTEDWQASEARASKDLETARSRHFQSAAEAIRWLLSND